MKKFNFVIVGFGSIGEKYYNILKKIKNIGKIFVVSKRKLKFQKKKYSLSNLKNKIFNYVIISNETSKHINTLKYFEKNFNDKIILVEKPLSNTFYQIKFNNNKVFIGYNLRFHPVLIYLKKILKKQKPFLVNCYCGSYLPKWRKKDYRYTISAKQKLGGGVLLELSHELDYLNWLFGIKEIKFKFNKKISNLQIDSDDYLNLVVSNKDTLINLQLNYFSLKNERFIKLYFNNKTIVADLYNSKVTLFLKSSKKEITFKKNSIIETYRSSITDLISKKFLKFCKLNEAIKLQKLILRIKKK